MSPAIAMIGLGEAGSAIAADLVAAGASVRGWDPVASPPEGVEPASDAADAAAGAEVVLSANSAAAALRWRNRSLRPSARARSSPTSTRPPRP